ncbi:transposase [Caldibacillus thermoamylovorans]
MVECVPDEQLFSHNKGGGRASYRPNMMLKIILYGYKQKIYSYRGIEKLTKGNIPTMWLAAMQQPDFRTINEFRGVRMQNLIDGLFETIIHKLIEENYITLENYFLDGKKIEADANKYSFVWKKSTSKFEAKLKEKIQETLKHIHAITELEAQENITKINPDTEISEQNLVEIANKLEGKVEQLTEEIEKETDSIVQNIGHVFFN